MPAASASLHTDDGDATERAGARRGIGEPHNPLVLGTVIGAVGSTVFVFANRGALPDPWPLVCLGVWAAAMLFYAWAVFLRPRDLTVGTPARRAGLIYFASCAAMVLLIAGGSRVLAAVELTALRPALIAMSVGLHFVPFARAFSAPFFQTLGAALATIGILGLVLGAVVAPVWASAAAVLAGLSMLTLMAVDACR